jgi:predicted HD superfamily hydrolase involved in NAD metabolism
MDKLNKKQYNQLREIILVKLEKALTSKRYEHTLRVEETAMKLAKIYGENQYRVGLSALLHDNAKNYPDDKKAKLCKKYHIQLSKAEQENIDLVHSKLGGVLAREKYNIHDQDIIHGIMYHTTGRPNMSNLEKIIYIADFIEPGRKDFPGLSKVRDLAYKDLDLALIKILMLTMNHIMDRGGMIDKITEETYEFYYKIYDQKTEDKKEEAYE